MKILYLARQFPYPADSGVKQRNWHILAALAKGYDVHLLCYGNEEDVRNPVVQATCRGVTLVPEPPLASGMAKLARVFLGLFSGIPYGIQARYCRAFKAKVEEVLGQEAFDLIVCDSLYHARHIPETSVPKLLNEHNIESVIIRRFAQVADTPLHRAYAGYETLRMFRYENKVWEAFDQIWMCSDIDRKEVLGRVPNARVEVVPNAVALGETANPDKVRPFSLIYTGLIGWKPNEDAVLYFAQEIYPLIQRKVKGCTWSVVGKGPKARVLALANRDPSINVTGTVPDITPYVQEAAVVVVPLRVGSGTRLKILEALAMGKAVVSTSVGCEGLDVTDGKNIVIADDPVDFAVKTGNLLLNPAECRRLGENGRKLVAEKYTWDVVGEIIKDCFASLGN